MRTDPTSKNYPVRLRTITIFVITGIALLAYLFPRFFGEPNLVLAECGIGPIDVISIPPTEQVERPVRPNIPTIPVPIDNDEFLDDNITIPELKWDDHLIKWKDVPPHHQNDWPPFVIYDRDPIPLSPISPEYPDDAVKLGIEGTVHVQVYIDKYGIIQNIMIINSDSVMLNEAALDAVKNTRWDPARQGDKKVGVTVVIPIKFQLH